MSLESLSNPVARLKVLPTAANLRVDPVTTSLVWQGNVQYYQNDLVLDPQTGGAIMMYGGSEGNTAVVGPAAGPPGAEWIRLAPDGANTFDETAVTGSTGALVQTTPIAALPANSKWQWLFQGTFTEGSSPAVALGVTDLVTVTASVAGGSGVDVDILPAVFPTVAANTATSFSVGGVVTAGAAAGAFALTAVAVSGGAAQNLSLGALTLIRVA